MVGACTGMGVIDRFFVKSFLLEKIKNGQKMQKSRLLRVFKKIKSFVLSGNDEKIIMVV